MKCSIILNCKLTRTSKNQTENVFHYRQFQKPCDILCARNVIGRQNIFLVSKLEYEIFIIVATPAVRRTYCKQSHRIREELLYRFVSSVSDENQTNGFRRRLLVSHIRFAHRHSSCQRVDLPTRGKNFRSDDSGMYLYIFRQVFFFLLGSPNISIWDFRCFT